MSTVAASIAGAISYLAQMAQWAALFGGRRDDEGESGSPLAALVMMIVGPIAAMMVQMAISRSREYGADEGGARIGGEPRYLARALRKIHRAARAIPMDASPATSHMSCAYLIRFARWHALLAGLGHRLPWWFNFRVYLAGLALTSTPGKLGETFRSVLLLQRGVGLPHSLAAFFADRLSDVIGVALLGTIAARLAGQPQPTLEVLVVAVFAGALAVRALIQMKWWPATLERSDRTGRPGRVLAALTLPASSWACVW